MRSGSGCLDVHGGRATAIGWNRAVGKVERGCAGSRREYGAASVGCACWIGNLKTSGKHIGEIGSRHSQAVGVGYRKNELGYAV